MLKIITKEKECVEVNSKEFAVIINQTNEGIIVDVYDTIDVEEQNIETLIASNTYWNK